LRSGSACFGVNRRREVANPDDRNFYKLEMWTKDRLHVLRLLYAGNNLARAKEELAAYARKRPRARLTIRQRTRVLEEWPTRKEER
jgi:hypothetical protein